MTIIVPFPTIFLVSYKWMFAPRYENRVRVINIQHCNTYLYKSTNGFSQRFAVTDSYLNPGFTERREMLRDCLYLGQLLFH